MPDEGLPGDVVSDVEPAPLGAGDDDPVDVEPLVLRSVVVVVVLEEPLVPGIVDGDAAGARSDEVPPVRCVRLSLQPVIPAATSARTKNPLSKGLIRLPPLGEFEQRQLAASAVPARGRMTTSSPPM